MAGRETSVECFGLFNIDGQTNNLSGERGRLDGEGVACRHPGEPMWPDVEY